MIVDVDVSPLDPASDDMMKSAGGIEPRATRQGEKGFNIER